jgi:DNA mismatch repair protein MutL
VVQAYESLIEKESFPFYVLFLEIDPKRVDVNVHPTKQEVKFDDDGMMYYYLKAAVKHSLSRYNIAPSLDFSLSSEIQQLSSVQLPTTERQREQTQKGYLFNTFSDRNQAHVVERSDSLKRWKDLYEIAQSPTGDSVTIPSQPAGYTAPVTEIAPSLHADQTRPANNIMLLHGTMLAATVKSGLMLVHIRRAQERILYERLLRQWNSQEATSQRVLFPATFELSPQDALLLTEALPDMAQIGFDIAPFGQNAFVVQGVPPGLPAGEEKNIIDEVVEHLKHESPDAVNKRAELLLARVAQRLTQNQSTAIGQPEEQQALIDELFACGQPEFTPGGKKVFVMMKKEELENMLG